MADVAQRWQLCPQQVFTWRREARDAIAEKPAGVAGPAFVPIVAEDAPAAAGPRAAATVPVIEVKLAGAVVRYPYPSAVNRLVRSG